MRRGTASLLGDPRVALVSDAHPASLRPPIKSMTPLKSNCAVPQEEKKKEERLLHAALNAKSRAPNKLSRIDGAWRVSEIEIHNA